MEFMVKSNDKILEQPKVAFKVSYSGYVSCTNTAFGSVEHCVIINEVLRKNDRQTAIDEIVHKMSSNDKIF